MRDELNHTKNEIMKMYNYSKVQW